VSASYFYTTDSWKKTALGTPIALAASRSLSELKNQRPILLMGGIHGDEPEGVALAEATLAWLKEQASKGTILAPWIVIPCLNVDGFRAQQRVNGRGVDLNRNYPARSWSPEITKERYHPGPSAGSEPEIQAVVEILKTYQPRLAIHCHSWNPCVVYSGDAGLRDAQRLADASGYSLQSDIGYPTPGSLSQFGFVDLGIPVICIEEQDKLTDLSRIWPRFAPAMREIFYDLSLRDHKMNLRDK
jgi:protein MpaA